MSRTKRWTIGLGGAALVGGVLAVAYFARDKAEDVRQRGFGAYTCEGPARIYHGRPGFVRRPCAVSADRIYEEIPEYQEIRRKRISKNNPRWHLLMREASKRFSAAINTMARKYNHDVVAEIGICRPNEPDVPEPPDRTQEVLKILRK